MEWVNKWYIYKFLSFLGVCFIEISFLFFYCRICTLSNIFFLFFFQCGDRKNRSINYHGDSDVSNRGQPAGLSSVNSTADERSASHAYTDRSKCLPLTIETPPVISLANNLRKVLFHIIWLTYQSHQFFQIIWFPFFFLYFGIQNPQILFLIIKFLLEFNLSLCFFGPGFQGDSFE